MQALRQMQIDTLSTEAAFELNKDKRVDRLLKNNHISQAVTVTDPMDPSKTITVQTNKTLHLDVPSNTPLPWDPVIRWVEPMWPTAIHSLTLNRIFNDYYRTTFSHSHWIKYIVHQIHMDMVDNQSNIQPWTFGETNPLQIPSAINDAYRYADFYSMYDLRRWEINLYRDNQLREELKWIRDKLKWMDTDSAIKFLYLIKNWINKWASTVSYRHYWKNKDFPIYNEIVYTKHQRYIGPETLVYYYNYDVYSKYLL